MNEEIEIKKPPILFDKTQDILERITDLAKGAFISYRTSSNGRIAGDETNNPEI